MESAYPRIPDDHGSLECSSVIPAPAKMFGRSVDLCAGGHHREVPGVHLELSIVERAVSILADLYRVVAGFFKGQANEDVERQAILSRGLHHVGPKGLGDHVFVIVEVVNRRQFGLGVGSGLRVRAGGHETGQDVIPNALLKQQETHDFPSLNFTIRSAKSLAVVTSLWGSEMGYIPSLAHRPWSA